MTATVDTKTTPWANTPYFSVRRVVLRNDGQFGVVFKDPDTSTFREILAQVKDIPGAQFEGASKSWIVPATPHAVQKFQVFLKTHGFKVPPDAQAKIMEHVGRIEEVRQNLAGSHAMDAEIDVHGLGGELRHFQRAGVAYAVRNKRVMIADDMGTGKTIQALATCQAIGAFPAVVVCPASLKINWYREAIKWLPGKRVSLWDAKGGWPGDVMIINYDVLLKQVASLRARAPKAVIFDESHYLKSRKAKRTNAAQELTLNVDVRLCLSGTPILNRPEELVTQLELLGRLEEFGGWWRFVRRYCGAHRGRFGMDTSGARNLEELNERLRATCFIRRRKADVLKELPPKQRSVVPLEIDNRSEYQKAEQDLIRWLREQAAKEEGDLLASAAERAAQTEADIARKMQAEQLVRIQALKRLAARGKMEGVVEWVTDFMESGEKLVIFAHHVEIVEELGRRFKAPIITGQTDLTARQSAVDRFQRDPACKVIALNLQAGGVGLTLTAASNVAFVELGWNPAIHDQAEDRCHRIGQEDQVTAWYLLAEKTIDEQIQSLIDAKRVVVTAATDGEAPTGEGSIMEDLIKTLKEDR